MPCSLPIHLALIATKGKYNGRLVIHSFVLCLRRSESAKERVIGDKQIVFGRQSSLARSPKKTEDRAQAGTGEVVTKTV